MSSSLGLSVLLRFFVTCFGPPCSNNFSFDFIMFKICQHHVSSRANIENRGMQKTLNMKRVIQTQVDETSKTVWYYCGQNYFSKMLWINRTINRYIFHISNTFSKVWNTVRTKFIIIFKLNKMSHAKFPTPRSEVMQNLKSCEMQRIATQTNWEKRLEEIIFKKESWAFTGPMWRESFLGGMDHLWTLASIISRTSWARFKH